jgi:CHAD domain-containing protein
MLAQGGEQMTTERTAIRRWLSVGGSPHRPPRRARKRSHRSIVAPLAATLAASAAVGLGMALAKGSLRPTGSRRPRRRLGLEADERLPEGLRRMAIAQVDLALAQVESAGSGDARKAVHEARKAIKRLRTIVRLLEGQLGPKAAAREHATLRAAAGHLAGARDAEVMLETLDGLIARRPGKLGGRPDVARLRRHLVAEREAAEQRMLAPRNRMLLSDELRLFRARALAWNLEPRPGIAAIEDGLTHLYRQGRRRKRRAASSRGGRMRTMHQWRKRVKDLRYAAEALRRAEPGPGPLSRLSGKRRKRISSEARWMRRLAGRADALGELLGEEHDLAVFGAWLTDQGKAAGASRATRRRLGKEIVRRRRKLRRSALRDGRRLYALGPRAFVRRVARAYDAGAPG